MECCGSEMKHYDNVKRIVRGKDGTKTFIFIERVYCKKCRKVRRCIPDNLERFKHYEKDIIDGVQEGLITTETLGFEDFPSEMTMKRWKNMVD